MTHKNFACIFESLCSKHAPFVTPSRKKCMKPDKPWITQGLKKSINHKYKLYHKLVNSHFDPILKNNFTSYRNILTKLLRKAKKQYYSNKFMECQSDSATSWKVINEILGETEKTNVKLPNKIITDDSSDTGVITDPKTIIEKFNNFFCNIGKTLANKINSDIGHNSYVNFSHSNNIFFLPVVTQDVLKEILSLDPSKSTGHDNIPARLLIDSASIIAKPLCHIINLSLQYGIFPEPLKIAKITPIFKKGSPYIVNNYRPISILPQLSNIFERIVRKQLVAFLDKFSLIYPQQYGFRDIVPN